MRMLERYYDQLTKEHPDRTKIQPVNITAAARWYYEDNSQEDWDYRDDYPAITPPFPLMWMEYESPRFINSNNNIIQVPKEIDSIGCMSICIGIKEGMGREVIAQDVLRRMVTDAAASMSIPLTGEVYMDSRRNQAALDAGREARWIGIWKLFVSTQAGRLNPMETVAAYVDENGQMITENYLVWGARDRLEYLKKLGASSAALGAFFFATSLMHAKNVSLESVAVPDAIRRRRIKDKKPCLTFKVLQINPIRQQVARDGSGGSGAKRAMHIVRGHFKDYRNGGGLFGKMKGLYWWDMHVAGDIANGQVVKDYAIGKPTP